MDRRGSCFYCQHNTCSATRKRARLRRSLLSAIEYTRFVIKHDLNIFKTCGIQEAILEQLFQLRVAFHLDEVNRDSPRTLELILGDILECDIAVRPFELHRLL